MCLTLTIIRYQLFLVGAVTHVLLSDATRGYGISIREMLDAAA